MSHEPRLSQESLPDEGSSAGVPAVDRSALTIGIVHFGLGAFHRAHQAVYTEDAMAATGDTRWGILGVTGRSEAVVEALRPQDGLYGLLEKDAARTRLRIVGSILEVASPAHDSRRVVEALADPRTHVATLTITEKGYPLAGGELDVDAPGVRADLDTIARELAGRDPQGPSRTPLGLLVRGLVRRYRTGGAPFTVVCCDNLTSNGVLTARAVTGLAQAAGGLVDRPAATTKLLDWLDRSVAFPATMVDRITPATTSADRETALGMTGLRDEGLVVAEPFRQWIIEDRFAGPRPPWDAAGAVFTTDVTGYEQAKLRILNASHLYLAYLGALAGHDTIAATIADPALARRLRDVIDTDILPTLDPPDGFDLAAYRDTVLERFANPALAHTTRQVAMDGSQKVPIRLLGTAHDRLASGHVPAGIALILAAWIRYIARCLAAGDALDDPLAAALTVAIGSADAPDTDPEGVVTRILAVREVFPVELARSDAFARAMVEGLAEVDELIRPSPAR